MVYVKRDGSVVSYQPFAWFWNFIGFFKLLFRTLYDPNYNKYGDKYETTVRRPGGGGPPRPPSRRYGGGGYSSGSGGGPMPPPTCGGCGCG